MDVAILCVCSIWALRHRVFPSLNNTAVVYTATLPCVMLCWFYARNRVKKHNSRLASYLCAKEWEKVFKGTVELGTHILLKKSEKIYPM